MSLLDNGNSANGDQIAGDGIYSALYTVSAPGHYNVLFNAEGSTVRSGTLQREQLMSLVVRNQPDFDETEINTSVQTNPGADIPQTLNIKFTPVTKGGYFMGPGWANYFWFTAPGVTPFKGKDNLDGTYTASVNFSGEPPALTLHFLDVAQTIEDTVNSSSLPISPDNDTAIGVVPPPSSGRWSLGIGLGPNFPQSDFENFFDGNFGVELDLEYEVNQSFAINVAYGFDQFDGKSGINDVDVSHLTLNGKLYFAGGTGRPFLQAGVGYYNFDPGDNEFGVNLGVGYQFDYSPSLAFEIKTQYHSVNTDVFDTEFFVLRGGIRWFF